MRWCVMGRGRMAVLLWPPLTRRWSVQVSRLVAAAAVRYSREGTPGLSQQALSVVSRLLLVPQQRHPDFLTLLAFADSIVDTHPFGEAWVVATASRSTLYSRASRPLGCSMRRRWVHHDL